MQIPIQCSTHREHFWLLFHSNRLIKFLFFDVFEKNVITCSYVYQKCHMHLIKMQTCIVSLLLRLSKATFFVFISTFIFIYVDYAIDFTIYSWSRLLKCTCNVLIKISVLILLPNYFAVLYFHLFICNPFYDVIWYNSKILRYH